MLGGGGAKGAYQVGVLKALDEVGILPLVKVFTGSSIGAINNYFYLASGNVNNVVEAWRYGTANNPFKIDFKSEQTAQEKAFGIINEMANKFTNVEVFKNQKKDLYVSVTKLENPSYFDLLKRWAWESEIIHLNKKETPLDYVISSATLPIILGFTEVANKTYIDGGFTNNNPIEPLIDSGCDLIFVSSLDLFYSIDKIKNTDVTIVNLTSKQALPRTPIKSYLAVIDFAQETFEKRMEYGYFVAKKMIEYIIEIGILNKKDNKYYLNDLTNAIKRINVPKSIDLLIKEMRFKDKGE